MNKKNNALLGEAISEALMGFSAKELLYHETLSACVEIGEPLSIAIEDINGDELFCFNLADTIMDAAMFEPGEEDGGHYWATELRNIADALEKKSNAERKKDAIAEKLRGRSS